MALPQISKNRRFLSKLATFWIPVKSYRQTARCILLMGPVKWWRIIRKEADFVAPHKLAIGAIMKNEGSYLKEWLDYHMLVGVEKFYLYDNDSTDDTKQVLAPYIDKGIVEYTHIPGKKRQMDAYRDILARHSYDTKWLALVDLDEFLVPVKHDTLVQYLETLPRNFWCVVMSWVAYGSSGHKTRPDGLVIENYKWRAEKQWGVKSIINPRLAVEITNPHVNIAAGFMYDENGKRLGRINQTERPPTYNLIRCNHYFTKSYQEYCARHMLGPACSNALFDKFRHPDNFDSVDRNDVFDDIMTKYVQRLKK